jgi:microcystin-dependent protein
MTAEVTMYAGSTAPDGWAFCRGQLLPISEYQKLFSPVPMGIGQGVALPERRPKGDGRDRTMLKKGEYTDPESSRYDLGFIKLNFIIKL